MEQPIPNDRLLDHTQGRLTPPEMAEISQKLAEDPKLQQRYAQLRRLRRLVRERYQPEAVSRPDSRDTAVGSMIGAYVEAIQSGVALPTMHLPNADFGRPASGEFSPDHFDHLETDNGEYGMPAGIAEIPLIGTPAHRSIWARARGFSMAAAATVLAALAVWSFVDDKPVNMGGIPTGSVGVEISEPAAPPTVNVWQNQNTPAPNNANTGAGNEAVVSNANSNGPAESVNANPNNRVTPVPGNGGPDEAIAPRFPVPTNPDAVDNNTPPGIPQPTNVPGVPGVPTPRNPETPITNPGNGNNGEAVRNPGGRNRGVEPPAAAFQTERQMAEMVRKHLAGNPAFEALYGRQTDAEREFVVAAATKRGDIDGNGIIDHRDADTLLRHILNGNADVTFGELADTNRDGRVDIRDHVKMMADMDATGNAIRAQD